ncbi:hypothetical protein FSP39_003830 [Pinctada imbricata]|uniref:Uncharacterized protein n=1 Tax=Pinctada imbricata TaxID=66713 RepID=A0AA88YM77_PINIB|nr:hypothetical protein FSP39_003830 [Pinctada imbricata]
MSADNYRSEKSFIDLKDIPEDVKSQKATDKPPPFKRDRVSSSGRSDTDEPVLLRSDLDEIKKALDTALKSMVSRQDIEEIVKKAMKESAEEIKKEIKAELKSEIEAEMKKSTENQISSLKTEYTNQMQEVKSDLQRRCANLDEKCAGSNLDVHALQEKFNKQESYLREIQQKLNECEKENKKIKEMANFNQQYSQKNNVKVIHWAEKRNENLRNEFCEIVQNKAGITVNPSDILAIHRVPHSDRARNGARPVIIKFISSDARIAVLRHRKVLKPSFTMIDHLTPLNLDLLQRLQRHPKIESSWYFNTRIYAYDSQGTKHKFDIGDDIDFKLRRVPTVD